MYSADDKGIFTPVADATANTLSLGSDAILEGYYYCTVNNILNGDTINKETALHAEVRNLPVKRPALEDVALTISYAEDARAITYSVTVDPQVNTKNWYYTWKIEDKVFEQGFNLSSITLPFAEGEVPSQLTASVEVEERIWMGLPEYKHSEYSAIQHGTFYKE